MDLSMFSPEQIAALKAQLNNDTGGRSPIRERQLRDLRLMPTATDPRPTFFLSTESPRDWDTTKPGAYAQLMWNKQTGDEITVHSEQERAAHADQYTTEPPTSRVMTPTQMVADILQSLSPEDRALVVKAQQAKRLEAATDAMAGLTDEQLSAVMKSIQPAAGRKTA
jgi:hypothetical protein